MNIDLNVLIENLKLDKKILANILFPHLEHPASALSRVLAGLSKLDAEQIYRLHTYTGLSLDALYEPQTFWKSTSRDNLVRFVNGEYTALYDPNTGITKIFHLTKIIAVHTITNGTQPLQQYLKDINQIIINQQIQKP